MAHLTITLDDVGLTNSDKVFFEIVEDKLRIVIDGGSRRRLPWSQNILLDASKSIDPNEELAMQKKLSFLWFCKIVNGNSTSGCFGNDHTVVAHEGPVWTIANRTLSVDVEYTFTVQVGNDLRQRTLATSQNLLLVDQEIPIVGIR